MSEFVSALSSYPTVLCTVLLGVALSYWLLVLFGAASGDAHAGHDVHDAGSLDVGQHHVDVSHHDVDVGHHPVGHSHGHDHGHDVATVHDAAAAVGLIGGLRRIPTTLAFTLVAFAWWLENLLATHYFGAALTGFLPRWAWGSLLLVGSLFAAVLVASLLARPLIPVFASRDAARRRELVGAVVEVRTGRVDRRFGQAQADNGGAGLLLEVRAEAEHGLRRGDRAVVIAYDDERELYEVAPLEDLLKNGK